MGMAELTGVPGAGTDDAARGSRHITHLLRLRDAVKPLANFFAAGVLNLREQVGSCNDARVREVSA
jgi:hypothetical protein